MTSASQPSPDDIFQALIEAHEGCTDVQSRRLDAALVLLLSEYIEDKSVILDAARRARHAILGDRSGAGGRGAGGRT